MKIVPFDELTPELDRERALVHLAAFGGVYPARSFELERRRLRNFADYVGVFALDEGRVVGQVFVQRIPYAFRDGPGTVAGIAAVGTRPDRGRTGVARRLLTEVHRRERAAGIPYAALWTNRSWGAHALYERLGYRDVYSSPWVVRAPDGRKERAIPGIRPGRGTDVSDVDRLHDRLAADRPGFYHRPKGFSRVMVRLGHLDPAKNLLVAHRGRELVGYAYLDPSPWRVVCGELLGDSAGVRRRLVRAVRRAARDRHAVFQHALLWDSPEVFRGPASGRAPYGWYGMMGLRLDRAWTGSEAVRAFATTDPRFLCLAGDLF